MIPQRSFTVGMTLVAGFALLAGPALSQTGGRRRKAALSAGDSPKLMQRDEIIAPFTRGETRTRVIVNLRQPQQLMAANLDAREPVKALATAVEGLNKQVIESLSADEIKLRRRFSLQAGFSGEVTKVGLDKLAADPRVLSIEPVRQESLHLGQGIPLMNASVVRTIYNGAGVAVAICDTGVDYTHPRLGGGGFPNSKVIGGYDTGDNDSNPFPYTGPSMAHGTCCAGIAAGSLGTVGDYIGGVAYNAKIYALKIADASGAIWSDNVVEAWNWCVAHKNDDPANPLLVCSNSFGGGRYFSTCDASQTAYATAVNLMVAAGISVAISSGNDGFCDSISGPACLSNAISVGAVYDAAFGTYQPCVNAASCAPKTPGGCSSGYYATDITAPDKVTSYSSTASFLNILAPSNAAYTPDVVGSNGYSGGDYYSGFGGTSAACPYAAGAIACLQSASMALLGSYLSSADVKTYLTTTGDGILDPKVAITKPRVNLGDAIGSMGEIPTPSEFFCVNLDANPGWTTSGQWAWGTPLGAGGGGGGGADPTSGYTGSRVYGVNLSGDYSTAVGGPFYLTTPAINCSGVTAVHVKFARWLNTDWADYVTATVEVSNNGFSWTTVYINPPTDDEVATSWTQIDYDLSSIADNQPTVYVRWGYQVVQPGAFAYSGWNIDDICFTGILPPRTITQWRSVRTHGGTPLSITLNGTATGSGLSGPTVETRTGGIQKIEIDFDGPISLLNAVNVGVSDGSISYVPTVSVADADTLSLVFTPGQLPDQKCYQIDINPGTLGQVLSGDTDCRVRALQGDTTMSGKVNLGDVIWTGMKAGLTAAANPQHDVNLSGGNIQGSDATAIKTFVTSLGRQAMCP